MVNCVIFSDSNPAQLDLLLRCIKRFFSEWNLLSWSVLYTYEDDAIRKGYEKVKIYHPDFAGTFALRSPDRFKQQLVTIVSPQLAATVFFKDSMVFKSHLTLRTPPMQKFVTDSNILCVSLGLCKKINYDFIGKRDIVVPRMTMDNMWFWKGLEGEWGNPMSLFGNISRTDEIYPLLESLEYHNVDSLECALKDNPINKPYMICYDDSKVFNIDIRKLQRGDNAENFITYLSREFLDLKRISTLNVEFFRNNSFCQEAPLMLEKAVKYDASDLCSFTLKNRIDYSELIKHPKFFSSIKKDTYDINMFIPIKNRTEFLLPCLDYIKRAKNNSSIRIRVVILENDESPTLREICKKIGVDYIFIPLQAVATNNLIAKALTYNLGYLLCPKAPWSLFHDIDILVDEDYFLKVERYLSKNPNWLQPYSKKRVLLMSKGITEKICNGDRPLLLGLIHGEDIREATPGSPGGSIVVKSDTFEKVGGYDPDFFYGYAPEDSFFWIKLECLFNTIDHVASYSFGSATYANDPPIEVYHMSHPPMESTNEEHKKMIDINGSFLACPYDSKMKIINMKKDFLKI